MDQKVCVFCSRVSDMDMDMGVRVRVRWEWQRLYVLRIGWASVFSTKSSSEMTSGVENIRYRYFNVSAIKKLYRRAK